MKHFKKFDEFFNHLIDSINEGKDVYVFGYTLNTESDYQFIEEDGSHDYYVHYFTNLNLLQESLSYKFVDETNLVMSLDYVHDTFEDGGDFVYQRLYIFRSK